MPDTPQRTPHSRHRAELRERAFELHCQLQSNRAIAAALDVPERTVRSWIKDIMDETTRGLKKRRVEFLREAVVGQRAIAAAAWNAFNLTLDHERARLATQEQPDSPSHRRGKGLGDEDAPNAAAGDNLSSNANTPAASSPSPRGTPWREDREVRGVRHSRTEPGQERSGGQGVRSIEPTTIYRSARLLHVAFAAQREIAHLLRLYDDDVVPKQPVEILITRNPPWPEPDPSDYIPGSPDDPNYRPDDDNNTDHDTHADPYAGTGLPDDLKPTGMDYWRELYGYPPRPMPGGPLDPTPAPAPISPRSTEGDDRAPVSSPSRSAAGPEVRCEPPMSEDQQPSSPSPRERGGWGVRSNAPINENPATPATAPASPEAANHPVASASPTPPPTTEPPSSVCERPDYPIAWLFPPGAPIPRPYRNAPPRPDRAFWNNPLRW